MSRVYIAVVIVFVLILLALWITLMVYDEIGILHGVFACIATVAVGGITLLGGKSGFTYVGKAECPCGGKDDCLTCGGHENELYDQLKSILKGETPPLNEVDELHDRVEPTISDILKLVQDNEEKLKKLAKTNPDVRKALDHIKHLVHDVKSTHRDIIEILDRI